MKLLKIPFTYNGIFLKRVNKFIGIVELSNKKNVLVHIHDPGRLNELLFPDNKVLLNYTSNPNRKTSFDLIAAKKQNDWIIINSMYHRKVAEILLNSILLKKKFLK